ncbi:kinase-like domain-containing protein [Rhizophagus irregularis DAOM 181602=DAOM 197198]|nr:kinase-like domain-containing protein [Rhizophagus irregularis DAOM 181602=DAOM 197198]
MDETPKNLWEDTDKSKYQLHVTIPTIDSTIESENVDERVVYIGDLEKRKQVWDIENQKWDRITKYSEYALKSLNNSSDMCSDFLNEIKSHLQIHLVDIIQCFGITQDPNSKDLPKPVNSSFQFSSDTNYTAQSTSVNPISECLDVQLSELELNEICQDGEDNIE